MVKLYRNVSWSELAILFREGRVEGQFNQEMDCNGYKQEYGSVVCCFLTPRNFDYNAAVLLLEINIPEERIIAEGFGIYDDEFEQEKHNEYLIKEIYISHYELDEVKMYSKQVGKTLYQQFQAERCFRMDFARVEGKINLASDPIKTFNVLYDNRELLMNKGYYEGLIELCDKNGKDIELYQSTPMKDFSYIAN